MPLGKSLAHPLYLSLQLSQVRFELSGSLLPIAEAPMEGVGILPGSAAAGIIAARGMAAMTGAGVPATVVVTSMASATTAVVF